MSINDFKVGQRWRTRGGGEVIISYVHYGPMDGLATILAIDDRGLLVDTYTENEEGRVLGSGNRDGDLIELIADNSDDDSGPREEDGPRAEDSKPFNPKDLIGCTKAPVGQVPDTAIAVESLAYLEGALKYGQYNWRISGVRVSIYYDAAKRHLAKWFNGEECDPVTEVPHLASVRACIGIIIDAKACGKLIDDRPPSVDVSTLIDDLSPGVVHLSELFKDYGPHQYTIADTLEGEQ